MYVVVKQYFARLSLRKNTLLSVVSTVMNELCLFSEEIAMKACH